MAMSLNRVQLIGNLTRDPDVKQIPGGQTVATFSVATSFSWNDSSGARQSKTEFHNIVAWRKLAEICGQYLKKGAKVFVEGKLQTRDWQGEDGVKRYRTEIVADNMIMLGGKGDGSSAYGADREAAGISGGTSSDFGNDNSEDFAAVPAGADEEVKIDDLPF